MGRCNLSHMMNLRLLLPFSLHVSAHGASPKETKPLPTVVMRLISPSGTPSVHSSPPHLNPKSGNAMNSFLQKSGARRMFVSSTSHQHITLLTMLQVANDHLTLRQPVRVTCLAHAPDSTSRIFAGTQLGHLRQYDTRAARKPVSDWRSVFPSKKGIETMEAGFREQYAHLVIPIKNTSDRSPSSQ